jgi:hypothetical protein
MACVAQSIAWRQKKDFFHVFDSPKARLVRRRDAPATPQQHLSAEQ